MRPGFLGSLAALLAGAGWAWAQGSAEPPANPSPTLSPRKVPLADRPPTEENLPGPAGAGEVPASVVEDKSGFPAPWNWGLLPPADPDWVSAATSYFWFRGEYLLWWVKNGPLPGPLVTTGSTTDNIPGALGQPGTRVLFGNQRLNYDGISGARLTGGFWLDDGQTVGVEVDGLLMATGAVHFRAASNASGAPLIAIPAINALDSTEEAVQVTSPGQVTGSVSVSSASQIWGVESDLVVNSVRAQGCRLDWLAGFRYLGMDEDLNIIQNSAPLSGTTPLTFNGAAVNAPSSVTVADRFDTPNDFYGGQLGGRFEVCRGRWFVDLLMQVALGVNEEVVDIKGTSSLNTPGAAPTTLPAGFFAVASNSGRQSHDRFAVVPEAGFKVGYQWNHWLGLYAGYNFLYWSNVVRPGQQIDRTVNPTQIPTESAFGPLVGPVRPAPLFTQTDFWAQGVTCGLELHF